ncbi:MAG: hypothetical protein H8E31_08345 [Planctomycetes bacterium]|nr:hypothetical protein [Planctomycetota bacterium]
MVLSAEGGIPSSLKENDQNPLQAEVDQAGAPTRKEPLSTDRQGRLRVTVVRREDDEPVAGAEVYLLDAAITSEPDFRAALVFEGGELANVAEAFGRHGRTDSTGSVSMPAAFGYVRAYASWGGLWGQGKFVPITPAVTEGQVVVQLDWDFEVDVMVVNGNNVPQEGISVAYRAGDPWPIDRNLVSVLTNRDGFAKLRHLGRHARRAAVGDRSIRHLVSLHLPLLEPVFAEIDPFAETLDAVQLVLPPTGSLEVAVLNMAGDPAKDGMTVFLQRRMPDEYRSRFSSSASSMVGQSWLGLLDQKTVGGKVRFDRVGLDLMLEIGALFSLGGELNHIEARGPIQQGEIVTIVLKQTRETPVVLGRLIDERGVPWTEEVVGCLFWLTADNQILKSPLRVSPDSSGGFRALCPSVPVGGPLQGRFSFVASKLGAVRIWGTEVVPEFPLGGVLDLGDLRLDKKPLVGGIVVDRSGAALPGIQVSITTRKSEILLQRMNLPTTPKILSAIRKDLRTWTDDRGQFIFHFPPSFGIRSKLGVMGQGEASAPLRTSLDFEPGQDDLRIVLPGG